MPPLPDPGRLAASAKAASVLLPPSRGRCRGPGQDCVVVQKPPKRGRMSDRCPFCGRIEGPWREIH